MRRLLPILIMMLLVVPLWGDPASGFESISPVQSGDAVAGLMGDTRDSPLASFLDPTSSKLEVAAPVAGSMLRRSLTQERVVSDGQVINFGLRSTESTEIGLTPFDRTQLSFSSTTETLQRLDQTVVGDRRVTMMGLRQGFGSSSTAGVLGFNRTQTSTTDQAGVVQDEIVQSIGLNATLPGGPATLGLTRSETTQGDHLTIGRVTDLVLPLKLFGNGLSVARHTNDVVVDGVLSTRDDNESIAYPFTMGGKNALFNYLSVDKFIPGLTQNTRKMDVVLPLRLLGQDLDAQRHVNDDTTNGVVMRSDISTVILPLRSSGRIAYTRSETLLTGVTTDLRQLDVEFPLKLHECRYLLERHDVDSTINGVQADSLITRFSGPLPFLRGSTSDYTILDQTVAGIESETRTLHMGAPIARIGQVDLVDARLSSGTTDQSQRSIKIVTPVDGLSLQHQITTTGISGTDSTQTITQVTSPKVSLLNGTISMNARMMLTETDATPTQRVTGVDMAVGPGRPLTLQCSLEDRDTGSPTGGSSRSLSGSYALSKQISLDARLSQNEIIDQPTASDRRVVLTAKPKNVTMTVGLLSWEQGGIPTDSSWQTSLQMGDAKKLNMTAEYKGVDLDKDGKIVAMPNPLTNVALGFGDPSHLSGQLKFLENPSQTSTERGLNLQFPALGGDLKLGYAENTADPRNPLVIRLATLYDASFQRRIHGNVMLNLGFRYCDVVDGNGELMSNIQISGGDTKRGGEIKLQALTGDFVPIVQVGVTPPDSSLDLSFSRDMGDDGQLMLTFRRIVGSTADETQGLLTYKMSF